MPIHPLVAALANAKGFPAREIEKCREKRDEAITAFLPILEQTVKKELFLEWEEEEALFFIVHLLGEFGEKAAFAPLIAFLCGNQAFVDEILGDAVTATINGVLISTFNGDASALEAVIDDDSLDEYIRASAFDAWIYLVADGRIDRDHAHTFVRNCAQRLQPRDGCFIWVIWMNAVGYLGFTDLHDEVGRACEDGRVDQRDLNYADFDRLVAEVAAADDRTALLNRDGIRPFTDTIAAFSNWAGFSEKDKREQRREEIEAGMADTVFNPHRHVGRNDPCPCGSGKKFKKCCGG